MQKLVVLAPVAIGLVVLLAFAAIFAVTFSRTWEAQSWPRTECEILAARAFDPPNDDSSSWEVVASWRYVVKESNYELHDASPEVFGMLYGREEAEAIAARYEVGEKVACYYDPDEPLESVLDRSAPPWSALLFAGVVGVILLGTIVGVIVALLHRRRLTRGGSF